MGIYQLPGSNAVEVAQAVRMRLDQLSHNFPAGLRYDIPLDTTKAVTAGIHEIIVTLVISLVLVILVVFLFLQGWRATLIPLMGSAGIPCRHVHALSIARLLHQYTFSLWIGARHRPRCG